MKKAGMLTAVLLALALVLTSAGAETLYRVNEDTLFYVRIEDDAGLLDEGEYDGVLDTMYPVTEYCNAGLYTYGGSSTEYVLNKAKTWGNSVFDGEYTMFIIDLATRQLAVYSSQEINEIITQSKAYSITDNVYAYASRGEYGKCVMTAFNQMLFVLRGNKIPEPMRYASNALLAILAAILLAYLFISARMEQEVRVSLPEVVTATAGVGAVITGRRLVKKVRHQSSSGGGGGFHGGGGGFGGGGGGGGGGSHGF